MPGWSWSILGVAVVLGTWAAWFWSPLRRLYRLMGLSSTKHLPEHAVDLLAKERPRDVLKLAQYSRSSVRDVFYDGLRDVKGLIARFGITPFIEVARISGPKTGRVFRYGFPLVQDQIHNTDDMIRLGHALVEAAEQTTPRINDLMTALGSLAKAGYIEVDYGQDMGWGPHIVREWSDPDADRRAKIMQEISDLERDFSGVWNIVGHKP